MKSNKKLQKRFFSPKQIRIRLIISISVFIVYQFFQVFIYKTTLLEFLFFCFVIPIIIISLLSGKWVILVLGILNYIATQIIILIFNFDAYLTLLLRGIIVNIFFIGVGVSLGVMSELSRELKIRTGELEEANTKLKKLDNYKNDFIANITHEFRSPLTVILGISELNIIKNKNDLDVIEDFKIVHQSSFKLKKSIDRLLNLAQIDAGILKIDITKVDIVKFINQTIDYYKSALKSSKIKIIENIPKKVIILYFDIEKLEEVINNIISNSFKYISNENGILSIELFENNKAVTLSIKDNGIGIDKKHLKNIFNRFEQVKGKKQFKHKGSGIGLAYSKQLIDSMGGKIWAESEGEGKGASFFIELKKGKEHFNTEKINDKVNNFLISNENIELIKQELNESLENKKLEIFYNNLNKKEEYDIHKAKILIIDDDKIIKKIAMDYLVKNNFQNFILASNGESGINAVYEHQPDIIICDYNLDDMTGDKIHNEINNNPYLKNIPFVFLSVIADQKIIYERREKGASAYLQKPINEKELIITVGNLIKKYYELKKVMELAFIDELSGLNNRQTLINRLNHEISIRYMRNISVVFFDIDGFKKINEMYSHYIGDQLIGELGKIIKSSMRNYDIAARYSNDGFVIVLPDTNLENAINVANELRMKVAAQEIKLNNIKFNITLSIGVSSLIEGEKYICKKLKINNLKKIYDIKNPEKEDWELIEKYKFNITEILLKMAEKALIFAKQINCKSCGFTSQDKNVFKDDKCPNCKSSKIIFGKNKVVSFIDIGEKK